MMDLYVILVPVYAVITLLTLFLLKISLRWLQRVQKKALLRQRQNVAQTPSLICYLFTQYTLINLYLPYTDHKIILICSYSCISILCFIFPNMFAFCFIGTLISLVVFTYEVLTSNPNQQQPKRSYRHRQVAVLVMASIGIILNILLCGLIYKNYINSFLQDFIISSLSNWGIDNFIVRPLFLSLTGWILRSSTRVGNYIVLEQQDQELMIEQKKQSSIQEEGAAGSPRKKVMSPSKIPQAHFQFQIKESNAENKPRIKKQKNFLPPLCNPQFSTTSENFGELSLDYFINSNCKKVYQDVLPSPKIQRINTVISEQDSDKTNDNCKNYAKDNAFNGKMVLVSDYAYEGNLQKSSEISNQKTDASNLQNGGKSFISNIQLGKKSPIRKSALLKIEQNTKQEFEQTEMNSPPKARKRMDEQSRIRRGKLSTGDIQRKVVKFTSGQPYLEYLPNMLTNEEKSKHRNFSKKPQNSLEYTKTKSASKIRNRKPTVNENAENLVPGFFVENL